MSREYSARDCVHVACAAALVAVPPPAYNSMHSDSSWITRWPFSFQLEWQDKDSKTFKMQFCHCRLFF